MLRDTEDYPDPEIFRPERHLSNDGNINANVRNPFEVAFGFGRRYGYATVSIL